MKKIFFLTWMILLIPTFSCANSQIVSADKQAVFNTAYSIASNGDIYIATLRKFCDNYIRKNKLVPQFVLFYQKRWRQVSEPIIKYEILETVERLISTLAVFVISYQKFTLLILTSILLLLVVVRRQQIEKWQEATRVR
jgi:hypothetical protein